MISVVLPKVELCDVQLQTISLGFNRGENIPFGNVDNLLLEDGSNFLLEDGGCILINVGGGGKIKPYDKEIEYLESNGTQYIDFGIERYVESYQITFEITRRTSDNVLISNYGSYGWFPQLVMLSGNALYINSIENNIECDVYKKYHIKHQDMTTTLYDKDYNLLFSTDGKKINPVSSFKILKAGEHYGYYRIYALKIEDKMDLIPVRKGNEGFMYDKVSGKLYGNSGSGEFILGKDL